MRYVIFLLIVTALFLPINSRAQDSEQIITPENVDQLQLVQTLGRGKALDAQWSPDGEWFGVLTSRGVWLYDGDDLTAEPIQVGDDLVPMTAFTFHPYKNQLVTAQRGDIVFWDIESRSPVREIEGFTGDITKMVISPDGLRLATVGQRVPFVQAVSDYYYSDRRSSFVLWDLLVGQPISTIVDEEFSTFGGMEFTPDGQYLMTNVYSAIDAFFGSNLTLSESTSGHHHARIRRSTINFDISPDGDSFLSVLEFWGPIETVSMSAEPITIIPLSYDFYEVDAAFTKEGDHVLIGGRPYPQVPSNEIILYSVVEDNIGVLNTLTGWIEEIAPHPKDNQTFAVVDGDGIVSFYKNWQPVYRFQHYQNPVIEMAISSDTSIIMTMQRFSNDNYEGPWGAVEAWNTTTLQPVFFTQSEIITSIVFSHNDRVALLTDIYGSMYIFDLATGRLLRDLALMPGCYIHDLDFSPDDSTLMILWKDHANYYVGYDRVDCSLSSVASYFEVNFGTDIEPFPEFRNDTNPLIEYPLIPQRFDGASDSSISDSDYAADASIVAFALMSEVEIWTREFPDEEQPPAQESEYPDEILTMDLSSDGSFVVYGGIVDMTEGQASYLFITGTGLYRMDTTSFEIERFGEAQIHAVAISPDDRLIGASEDATLVIRDAASMDILHTMETGRANAIQFTADGTKLVIGGEDGVVRIWAVE